MPNCPNCPDVPLRDGARYCANCGLETRQECPVCRLELRYMAVIEPLQSVWCANQGAALSACEKCGRWLSPDFGKCPDPHCGGRVLPALPQHTGRRWDGRGGGAGYTWPARWSEKHPEHRPPETSEWRGPKTETVHAALAAHGRLSLWTGTRLVTLETSQAEKNAPLSVSWQNPLPNAARPKPGLPFEERLSVIGSAAVLCAERDFYVAGLYDNQGSETLDLGVPLAQAGSPEGWAGWSERNGETVLHFAAPPPTWSVLNPARADTPPEARLASRRRLAAGNGRVYWPGTDGAVWQCDFRSGAVTRAVPARSGVTAVWAAPDGVGVVYESAHEISFGLSAGDGESPAALTPAGRGAFRGVFAQGEFAALGVGDVLKAFQSQEYHSSTNLPSGQAIASAVIASESGVPRLLTLVLEGTLTRLFLLEPATGGVKLLWTGDSITPLGLLPVGGDLFLIHDRGVIRLWEAAH